MFRAGDNQRQVPTSNRRGAASLTALAAVLGVVLIGAIGWTVLRSSGPAPFPGSADDLDELGRVVLAAFNANDTAALASVRLSEVEHNDVIWPELPAAQARNPFPLELAWANIDRRNTRAVRRMGPWFEKRAAPKYNGTTCRGDAQAFETFRVMTDCFLEFTVEGVSYEAQLYKDVLVRNGGFKVFRYYDDGVRKLAAS